MVMTKEDLKNNLRKLLKSIDFSNEMALIELFQKQMVFIDEHYDQFSENAKEMADEAVENLINKSKEIVEEMDEGPQKQQMQELFENIPNRYYIDSKKLIEGLEKKSTLDANIIKSTRIFFNQKLQIILNLLLSLHEDEHEGKDDFAKISLFYFCIDELLAAFHLAQHSYINQAYSHIRSIYEMLDKIELFDREPKWAKLWMSKDPKDKKKIIHELSPSSVREKLGRDRYDKLYSMFSELGPHGTFTAVQQRSAIKMKNEINEDKLQINFWIGGSPFEHNIIWIMSFLVYSIIIVLIKLTKVYDIELNEDKWQDIIIDMKEFISKYYLEWAEKQELDTQPIKDYFNELDI